MKMPCIPLFLCSLVLLSGVLLLAVSPWFSFTFNMSNSLPGCIYLIAKGKDVKKGDAVAFYWQGGATYPAGTIFIKQIVGMDGEVVRRSANKMWVNNHYVGIVKSHSRAGVPLAAAPEGVIAPGSYFVATPHPDSLDSRYSITGNIRQRHIIGKAYVVF